ncbi:MAG: hypothetical protein ACOCZ5_03015 [bacterium]
MKKLKEVMVMLFCISFIVASFGCMPKDVSTESGKDLPKDFVLTYTLLDNSEELSTTVGKLTNDLLKRNIINEEEKDKIGDV